MWMRFTDEYTTWEAIMRNYESCHVYVQMSHVLTVHRLSRVLTVHRLVLTVHNNVLTKMWLT